jgi:DNA topoisomerase-1
VEYADVPCPVCGEEHGGELVVKKMKKSNRTFYGCSRYPECEYSTWKLPNGDDDDEDEIEEEIELTG